MRSPSQRLLTSGRGLGRPRHRRPRALLLLGTGTVFVLAGALQAPWASAAPTRVGLGKATPFAVLGASEVTNTGASVISGDLGVSPGTSVTGTPHVIGGSIFKKTSVAATAQAALGTAYTNAAGRSKTTPADFSTASLGGKSLVPGVYNASSTLHLTGTLTLNGNGDPNSVFVFQAGSSLITASTSTVVLIGGAQACNVFWKVGSSATLGSTSTFVGSILALTSITLTSKVTVTGRVLARNGAVTLIDDTITRPSTCITATSVTPAPTISTITPSSGPTSGGTTVVITGTGFSGVSGVTGVRFGTMAALTYTVTSTTKITATSPAGSGVVTVTVTTGGKRATKTAAFTYHASTTTTTTTTPPAGGATTPTTAPGATNGTTAPGATGSLGASGGGTVIPLGAPDTGMGGASRSGPSAVLLTIAGMAFVGAVGSFFVALRRRRAAR